MKCAGGRYLPVGGSPLSELDDLVAALAPVVTAFQNLRIRHYIGGSVASSFHGAARSTIFDALLAVKTNTIMHGRGQGAECVCHDVIGLGLSDPLSREFFHRELCLWS